MAEGVPLTFALPNEGVIASYSYQDIANGTGYVAFYCMDAYDGSTTKNILTTNTSVDSMPSYHYDTNTATLMNETFETTINSSRTMNGRVYVYVPYRQNSSGGSMLTTVTLYKNSTSLGTASYNDTRRGDYYATLTFSVTNVHFAKGDLLKLNVTVAWTESAAGHAYVIHRPTGRDQPSPVDSSSFTENTQMALYAPFRIEV